jgi:hypothetical protein
MSVRQSLTRRQQRSMLPTIQIPRAAACWAGSPHIIHRQRPIFPPDKPTVDWSRYNQPFGELKAATYTPTQHIGNTVANALMGLGMQPYTANDLTSRVGNVLGLSPLGVAGSALDLVDAKRRDDLSGAVAAAAGMIPGARGVARGVAEEAGAALRRALPKDVAFATHEAIPGADTGHLPGSINASPEARAVATVPAEAGALRGGSNSLASRSASIYNPPAKEPRPFEADYPSGCRRKSHQRYRWKKSYGSKRCRTKNAGRSR